MEGQGSKLIEDCEKDSKKFREKIEKRKQDIHGYNNILYEFLGEYLQPKVIDTIATLRRTYVENVLDSDVEDKSASYLNTMMSDTVDQLANRNETLKKRLDFESNIDKYMIELGNMEKQIILIEQVKKERVLKAKNLLGSINEMVNNSSLVKFVDSMSACYSDLDNPSPCLTKDVDSLNVVKEKFQVDLREKVKHICEQEVPDVGVEEEELQRALAASMGNKDAVVKSDKEEVVKADNSDIKEKQSKPSYPPLPEEPKVADKNLLCMVGVRLPDGRMLQRNFLLTDPIQLLWSFCYSQFDEDEARPFELTRAIHGASVSLDYAKNLTFGESGLANSMVSVTWE